MPRLATPLTDTQVRNAKAKDKIYTLADGEGMYLEINPAGKKTWIMQYRQANGKNNRLTFGRYPEMSLAEARVARAHARKLKAGGVDPAQARRINKRSRSIDADNTFKAVALAWHANQSESWQPRTAKNAMDRLSKDVFPVIGLFPIKEITAPIVLDMLRQVEKRGAVDMAKRLGQWCSQIFRYAIAAGIADNDPIPALRGALKKRAKRHHASITPDELPALLAAIEKNEVRMYEQTRILLRLMLLTFVRTNELTETPWDEIDLVNEEWVIHWSRMKMGRKKLNPRKVDHHVFLPSQGWTLLRDLYQLTGGGKYLFPNKKDHERPASNAGILAALERMGYKGTMTGHGFRSLAMGVIKEKLGYRHEVVDRQLAHQSKDIYGEAYDRAEFKLERKVMMQAYADYIDSLSLNPIKQIRPLEIS